MPVHYRKYNSQKIAQHKSFIETASKKEPKFYKIFVDDSPAVPKTANPEEFDNYEDFLTPDSRNVSIVIYCSAHSNRNDKYHYSLTATSDEEALEEGLSGMPDKGYKTDDLKELKEQRIQRLLESAEIKKMQQQLDEMSASKNGLQNTINEKDKELDRLFKALELAEANRNTIHGLNVGRVLADAGEALLRKNTAIIAKIPGLDGLATAIDEDTLKKYGTKPQEPQQEENVGEVNFKKKGQANTEAGINLTPQEKEFLRIFGHVQQHFGREELEQVIEILDILSLNKGNIKTALELLQEKKQTQ